MSQPVDVVYLVEHTARELDVACAVRCLLEVNHGRTVKIASLNHGLDELLADYEPAVVTLPYCTSVHDYQIEKIVSRWPRARYIDLAYEQILGKTQKSFKAPRDEFARETVLHSAWGDFFVRYLTSHGVPEDRIVVNGNPALALYREPYAAYYGDARADLATQFDLNPDKRWVFVPENYGWGFFTDKMVRDRIRRGFNPKDAFRYRDFAHDSLREVSRWWADGSLSDRVELIVRPRPAIPRDEFESAVRKYAGGIPETLHIIKHGSVREWILASDVVISSYSTTLLDAAAAGKPVYMLAPIEFPEFLFAEWYPLTAQLYTYEEFAAAITRKPVDRNWEDLQAWVTTQMLGEGDGIANLVDMLEGVLGGGIPLGNAGRITEQLNAPSFSKTVKHVRKWGWNLYQSLVNLTGRQTHQQSWKPHEADSIDPSDIDERVARWWEVLLEGDRA